MDDIQHAVVDCDGGWFLDILTHHVGFLDADGHSKVLAGAQKAVHEPLQLLFGVSDESGVISKEHVSDQSLSDLGIGFESGKVIKFAVGAGAEVDALCTVSKGLLQHDSKEDAKEHQREYTALLYSTANVERLGGGAIKLYYSLHVRVE